MTSFRELWRKFRQSFDLFMESLRTIDRGRRGILLRLGVLCVILSLTISVAFRASLTTSLIPSHSLPLAIVVFFAIELILGAIVIAVFLKTTGRMGFKFLVVAVMLVAFGILIWSNFSNAFS
jgi:hypothetical protein